MIRYSILSQAFFEYYGLSLDGGFDTFVGSVATAVFTAVLVFCELGLLLRLALEVVAFKFERREVERTNLDLKYTITAESRRSSLGLLLLIPVPIIAIAALYADTRLVLPMFGVMWIVALLLHFKFVI